MQKNEFLKHLKYNPSLSRTTIRKNIVKYNIVEYKCSICNIKKWNNKSISFHLDHIDGDRKNYVLKNLRFLCPNCDSQTETYCTKINITKYSESQVVELYVLLGNINKVLINLNLAAAGANYTTIKKILKKNNIPYFEHEKIKS